MATANWSFMESAGDRLESYSNVREFFTISPERLAQAGFYYAGIADRVTCAFCGGSLQSWDSTDDPYEQHRRYYPDCSFIRSSAGSMSSAFRDNREEVVADSSVPRAGNYAGRVAQPTNGNSPPVSASFATQNPSSSQYNVLPTELRARLDKPMTRMILDMGYDARLVEKAIYERLKSHGEDFPTAAELLDAVLRLQD